MSSEPKTSPVPAPKHRIRELGGLPPINETRESTPMVKIALGVLLALAVWHLWVADAVGASDPVAERLAEIRSCESGGDYQAASYSKTEMHFDGSVGSFGAYQIGQPTWDWVAGTLDAPYLVGMRPDLAPPNVQDMIAARLLWLEANDDLHGTRNFSWRVC